MSKVPAGLYGETTCSSNGETSDSTVVGYVPVQVGPAASVPVHSPVPESGMAVAPVGAPPVAITSSALMSEAGRCAMYTGRRSCTAAPWLKVRYAPSSARKCRGRSP